MPDLDDHETHDVQLDAQLDADQELSPDCKAGKCTGCTGDAWDVERDQMTPCEHACHPATG